MPERAPRPCRQPGCAALTTKQNGFCDSHSQSGWSQSPRQSASKRGYGAKWRKLRARVLVRDKHLCQVCLAQGIITPGNEVDHITPKYLGGDDSPSNLQAICTACHKAKTVAERGKGASNL